MKKWFIQHSFIAFILFFLIVLISPLGYSQSPGLISISPQQAYQFIGEHTENPDFVIVDLRPISQWEEERLENAISHLDLRLNNLQQDDKSTGEKQYILYAEEELSQEEAFGQMKELAISQAYQISGGIRAWLEEGLPTLFFKTIEPEFAFELIQKNKKNPDFMIIDLRVTDQWEKERIDGSINMNVKKDHFLSDLKGLSRDKTYLIHCQKGSRSSETLPIMREYGFKHIYQLKGGINRWIEKGMPTVIGLY